MADLKYIPWASKPSPINTLLVDGCAAGFRDLSHFPGNNTPELWKHDLSTGICLSAIFDLDWEDWIAGLEYVTCNNFCLDGFLSLLVITQPDLAQYDMDFLVEAACTGDFRWYTGRKALELDFLINEFADSSSGGDEVYGDLLEKAESIIVNPGRFLADSRRVDLVEEEVYALNKIAIVSNSVNYVEADSICSPIALLSPEDTEFVVHSFSDKPGFWNLYYAPYTWFEKIDPNNLPRRPGEELAIELNELEGEKIWQGNGIEEARTGAWNTKASRLNPEEIRSLLLTFLSE